MGNELCLDLGPKEGGKDQRQAWCHPLPPHPGANWLEAQRPTSIWEEGATGGLGLQGRASLGGLPAGGGRDLLPEALRSRDRPRPAPADPEFSVT